MSKILIHSIVFSPDGVSTAYLYNDIAKQFQDAGFDVCVLTTTPHYNRVEAELEKQPLTSHCFGLYYTSNYHGILVKHIPQKKFKSSILRLIGFVYWHILSFFLGLSEKKIDVILSPSPPLTIGFINIVLAWLKGCKVIYNVQEIYPDLLIEEGGLKSKPIISTLKWLERFVYNRSDAVTTIDRVFYNTIVGRFDSPDKLKIIPNFVDTSIYRPIAKDEISLDRVEFPETSALKVMYAGNIGLAQDWEPLIKAAVALKDENIEFFVIGEGVMKSYLQKQKEELALDKLHLLPYQPRDLMPYLIAYSDIQFVFMSPQTEGHGFPSKVYTVMACGKPMLVCSGVNTPIVEFLKDKGCAQLITTRDMHDKTDGVIRFFQTFSREELEKMGMKGLSTIITNYSKDIVTNQYVKLAESVINEGRLI